VMLLTTVTVQSRLPPPPLPWKLHWLTDVTRSVALTVVVGAQVRVVNGSPRHDETVTVELLAPVPRSRLLVTVTSQANPKPAPSSLLHCSTARSAA